MDVKIKDRKRDVEILRMALNMCEIGVDYPQADMINRVVNKLSELKEAFSMKDGIELHSEWKKEWQDYFQKEHNKKGS